jgi:hypothetical protein
MIISLNAYVVILSTIVIIKINTIIGVHVKPIKKIVQTSAYKFGQRMVFYF